MYVISLGTTWLARTDHGVKVAYNIGNARIFFTMEEVIEARKYAKRCGYTDVDIYKIEKIEMQDD